MNAVTEREERSGEHVLFLLLFLSLLCVFVFTKTLHRVWRAPVARVGFAPYLSYSAPFDFPQPSLVMRAVPHREIQHQHQ
jgi:hypothetical protein